MLTSKATLHARLRSSTRALHEELECAVGIGERIATRAAYTAYLARLWTLHTAAEQALDRLDFSPLGFTYRSPYRSRLLAADLAELGVAPKRLCALPLPTAPRLDEIAAGLGCVYVLEGSAKGARAILPQIEAGLDLDADRGASFFKGFGLETKRMWQACLAAINGVDPDTPEAELTVGAAVATFRMFRRGLAPRMEAEAEACFEPNGACEPVGR